MEDYPKDAVLLKKVGTFLRLLKNAPEDKRAYIKTVITQGLKTWEMAECETAFTEMMTCLTDMPQGWDGFEEVIQTLLKSYGPHPENLASEQLPVTAKEILGRIEYPTYVVAEMWRITYLNPSAEELFRLNLSQLIQEGQSGILEVVLAFAASFKITEQSLENLKTEGVPNDILEKLESIKNQELTGERKFVGVLETAIGEEQTVKFKSLILEHAAFAGERIENLDDLLMYSIGRLKSDFEYFSHSSHEMERLTGVKRALDRICPDSVELWTKAPKGKASNKFDSTVIVLKADNEEGINKEEKIDYEHVCIPLMKSEHRFGGYVGVLIPMEDTRLRLKLGQLLGNERLTRKVLIEDKSFFAAKSEDNLTVLFADIEGFRQISVRMLTFEILEFLNDTWNAIDSVVRKYCGLFGPHGGDGFFCFFPETTPFEIKDHALRALQCAKDMQLKVKEVERKWRWKNIKLLLNIGIHTGTAIVGNVASRERIVYSTVGSDINIGSRIQLLSRNGKITASQETTKSIEKLLSKQGKDIREWVNRGDFDFQTAGDYYKGLHPQGPDIGVTKVADIAQIPVVEITWVKPKQL